MTISSPSERKVRRVQKFLTPFPRRTAYGIYKRYLSRYILLYVCPAARPEFVRIFSSINLKIISKSDILNGHDGP